MSFSSWLYGKGIAGAISKDLLAKYFGIKRKFEGEEEKKTLERVWNFWLTLNEESIRAEGDMHHIARLDVIKEKNEDESELAKLSNNHDCLLDIYYDVLYIETEITTRDGNVFDSAVLVFVNESIKHGLDFRREYESMKETIKRLGF